MKDQSNVAEQFTATVTRATPAIPDLGIKPMPNIILGIPLKLDKTESGIVIPESAQEQNIPRVRIVALGEGADNHLEVGDVVHYAPYSQQVMMLSINNHKVIKLYFDEIIGVER
jgi:co-chaperonin GroES (HSP10)